MAVDLTGLTPYRQASSKLLDQSFQPLGGVPDDELTKEIQKKLWGTGESAGVYSQMARRGLNELQPETMYASARTVRDSIQDLANQYQARQRAAIETGRTTEMVEPNFRLTEAGVTGDYGGTPTLENLLGTRSLDIRSQEAATRSKQLEEELDFRRQALLGSSIGALAQGTGLLDYVRSALFGTSTSGTGGGGLIGSVAGGATQGLVPRAFQAIGEWLGFGSDIAKYTPEQRAVIDSMARQDAMVELMTGQGGAAGGAVGGGAGGAVGGAVSGVGTANTVSGAVGGPTIQGLFTGTPAASTAAEQAAYIEMARQAAMEELAAMGGPTAATAGLAAGVGPAAPSIEAGLIEMLGPELAAQLGYTAAPAAAGLTAGLTAGVPTGFAASGAAGAGLGSMSGAGGAGLGAGATAGALAAPLLIGALNMTFGKQLWGGDFPGDYKAASESIANKIGSGYTPAQLGRELSALPAMDVLAATDKIASQIGLDPTSLNQVSNYSNVRDRIAPQIADIMVREQRYPTQQEFLSIAKQASNEWNMANWQNLVAVQQSEGKSTIDMTQPPRLWS